MPLFIYIFLNCGKLLYPVRIFVFFLSTIKYVRGRKKKYHREDILEVLQNLEGKLSLSLFSLEHYK